MGLAAGHQASLIPYERSGRSCYCHANNGISFVTTLIPVWPFQCASTVPATPRPPNPFKQPLQQCSSVETINKSIRINSYNCTIVYLSSAGPKQHEMWALRLVSASEFQWYWLIDCLSAAVGHFPVWIWMLQHVLCCARNLKFGDVLVLWSRRTRKSEFSQMTWNQSMVDMLAWKNDQSRIFLWKFHID